MVSRLVATTSDARLDVRSSRCLEIGPVVLAGNDLECLVLAWVTCERVIVLLAEGGTLDAQAQSADPGAALARAFTVAEFSGKAGASVELLSPRENGPDRLDRKSTRLNSSHSGESRMPSSA